MVADTPNSKNYSGWAPNYGGNTSAPPPKRSSYIYRYAPVKPWVRQWPLKSNNLNVNANVG